jgi:uncharacterized protein
VFYQAFATTVCVYGAISSALFLGQRRLLFRPGKSRPKLHELGLVGAREVAVVTRDGLSLRSWYRPPVSARPVVLYLHGNGGHIGYRSQRLRRFAGEGYGALMLEYRGYGGNPGRPSETGLCADGEAAMAFLEQQGIAAERVILWGESLGSAVAVHLAGQRQVAAIVLEAPFTSVAALAQLHYPLFPAAILVRDRFDSLARIGGIQGPLLVLHGGRDRIVPIRFGRQLLDAAPQPKEGWFAPEAEHENLAAFGALDAAIAFIERLPGNPALGGPSPGDRLDATERVVAGGSPG